MAVTEIHEFKDKELEELSKFFYDNNPDHPELGNKELLLWSRGYRFVSRSRGAITGYIAQIPHIFRYGDKSEKTGIEHIGWSVALILKDFGDSPDAARRRTAYTHELLSKVENNPPWQFAAVGVVPEIEEFYRIRGHNVRRDCAKMYSRFTSPAKMLGYVKKSAVYSFPVKMLNCAFKYRRKYTSNKIKKITVFNPDWDNDWNSLLSSDYELYGERTAAYLNYKLTQPAKNYYAYIHSNRGYIIFREARHFIRDLHIVKICDLVGTENARFDLIGLALDFAGSVNAYGVVALGSVADEPFYRRSGLFISKPYVVTLNPKITSRMHVTFFDADLDNLW
ncbi:MAG: hypothetical protein JSU85_08615 [Candidatus Zixiibacteriota bacterium]|nr:MAG: hypothetical protein JSU85_08615 [candidate division Zixibacteria bacterium]